MITSPSDAAHALTTSRSAVLSPWIESIEAVEPSADEYLLACIADGPRIQRVYEQLMYVNAQRGFASTNAQMAENHRTILNAPEFMEWLPKLGYKPVRSYGDTAPITTWHLQQGYHGSSFIEGMRTTVKTTVARPTDQMAVWSTVQQRIDMRDITAALAGSSMSETMFDFPAMVAWAVHKVATTTTDFPWEITPTGIQRSLPPWPVRTPSGDEPRPIIMSDSKGTSVPCHAWVIDVPLVSDDTGGPTIFLSVSGSPALLKMTKANWTNRSNRKPQHQLPAQNGGLGVRGSVNPQAHWMGAAVSDAIHGVYVDDRVLTPSSPHFYHITGTDGVPDWTLLFDQINRCLLIPIDYVDIESLWASALSVGDDIVVPLKSYGCQGYRINVDCLHQWAIAIGHATGRAVTVRFVGKEEARDEDEQLDAADLMF